MLLLGRLVAGAGIGIEAVITPVGEVCKGVIASVQNVDGLGGEDGLGSGWRGSRRRGEAASFLSRGC